MAIRIDGIHDYFPSQVELGEPMLKRFTDLVESDSPFLPRAKVYNQLLVDVAFLTEDGLRLERCAHYSKGTVAGVSAETVAVQGIEAQLDKLYRLYGRLFAMRNAAVLADFDHAAVTLGIEIDVVRKSVEKKRKALQRAAWQAGKTWPAPPTPEAKPIAITPDGKPNQLVFATRSRATHFDLEAPLTISRLHSVRMYTPSRAASGEYDFQSVDDQWSQLKSLGATQASIATSLAIHDKQVTPPWFRSKYANDPAILMSDSDGVAARITGSDWPLNTWRPEVREMTVDLVTQLGEAFRQRPEFLWYVTAPENAGPQFRVEVDGKVEFRSTGYNTCALPDFHDWLRQRYTTITGLNRQWRTHYEEFASIRPPADLYLAGEWERPHPLAYEFQSWRIDRHIGWLKLIYDTLKAADPTKPVFASHSRLLVELDASRLFETADILGYHANSIQFMLGSIYIHSLNRFAKQQLGQYESWWGNQEDSGRISEEKIQRRALMKYLYRLTVWGRHIQVCWYAYTTGDYMLDYDANWFNPVYDLTTLRYSAAALPVGKAKVKRLESVFINSEIVRSRIAMIQPTTSMLFQARKRDESYLEMVALHKLLFANSVAYELIPETYFVDGRADLSDFDVVLLPYAPFFPDGFDRQLSTWVKGGGLLIAAGPFGIYDKFGFDAAGLWMDVFGDHPWMDVFGDHPEKLNETSSWRWLVGGEWADENWLDTKHGKGRVVTALQSLGQWRYRTDHGGQLLSAVREAAPPPVSVDTQDFELTLHQGEAAQRYLCVLNRNMDAVVEEVVSLRGAFTQGVDLDVDGGFPVAFRHEDGATLFDLRLAPGEFTVLALSKGE